MSDQARRSPQGAAPDRVSEVGVRILRGATTSPALEVFTRLRAGICIVDRYETDGGAWDVSQVDLALSTVRDLLMANLSVTEGVQLTVLPD
jgi:hypothetical protein